MPSPNQPILDAIVKAQDILHTLQWELEKVRDKDARREIIQMIDSITNLYIKYDNEPESQ